MRFMLINHLIFKKLDEYNKKLEKINCFMLIHSYADNSFYVLDIDLVIIGPISKEISLYKKQIDSELKN